MLAPNIHYTNYNQSPSGTQNFTALNFHVVSRIASDSEYVIRAIVGPQNSLHACPVLSTEVKASYNQLIAFLQQHHSTDDEIEF
jgi:hypothetical protein